MKRATKCRFLWILGVDGYWVLWCGYNEGGVFSSRRRKGGCGQNTMALDFEEIICSFSRVPLGQ